jgi:hypothetical protein
MSSIRIPLPARRTVGIAFASLAAAAFLLPRLWADPSERLLELTAGRYGQVLGVQEGELYYQ